MFLILVRHGQSEADIEKRLEGRYDSDLTELGYLQANAAAKWISNNYNLTKIITSPLKRTLHTANVMSHFTNTDVIVNDDLMEWNNGILAGMLRSEAEIKYPLPKNGRKSYEHPLGTESLIQFRTRIESFWQEFIDTHQNDECVCIVTHGGTIRMLIASILNLPIINDIKFKMGDCSINIFNIENNEKVIVKINFTEYLI